MREIVEACPSVEPAGILGTKSRRHHRGILELVRTRQRPEAVAQIGRSPACNRGMHQGVRLCVNRVSC